MLGFLNFFKKTKISYSRQNIYARDKARCMYCFCLLTKNTFTIDHIKPKSKGGKPIGKILLLVANLAMIKRVEKLAKKQKCSQRKIQQYLILLITDSYLSIIGKKKFLPNGKSI
ncbi:MAG: HNH endonuclease [Anaerolineales bacterium]|nr:HNH endonuclease [Anaerolineales bacterium]